MRTTPSRAVLLGRSSIVMVLMALGMAVFSQSAQPRATAPQPRPSPSPSAIAPAGEATWEEADRLAGEQKYEAAAAVIAQVRVRAQTRGDEDEWARALVREAQLRSALHGFETVVRFLRETPWPPGPAGKAVLDLFYGQTLVRYLQAYSWEIRQRERVESKDPLDLKKWTVDEIAAEATRVYARVFAERDRIGADPVDRIGDYLQRGTYPARIRGTVRDAVSYLTVELLADTALWTPAEHELYRLDVTALLGPVQGSVDDRAAHPLTRLAAVLADLENWHASAGRREAAFEARLERLRRLHTSFTTAEDRKRIRDDLEARLPTVRDLEWWSEGQAVRAGFVKEEDAGDALVRAHAIAEAGAAAYPDSIGAQRCRAIVAAIEAPAYQLTTMTLDGPDRRSIEVDHANLPRLLFRAYAVDLGRAPAHFSGLQPPSRLAGHPEADRRRAAGGGVDVRAAADARLPPAPDVRDAAAPPSRAVRRGGLRAHGLPAREGFEPGSRP